MAAAERTVRVGLLCGGTTFQRWQAESIARLRSVPGVELVVLVLPDPQTPPLPNKRRWPTALYRRYRDRHFRCPAMGTVDLAEDLHGIPRLQCLPDRKGPVDHFSDADLERIAAHRPDVLLRFGFNILGGGILDLPRYGVWSFHHGDPTRFRGGPPGLWEIIQDEPVTGAVLQRLTAQLDGGHILRQGWFRTVDHSLRETADTVLMQSAAWPAQVARELLAGHTDAAMGSPPGTLGTLYRYPDNHTFLRFLWKQFHNKLRFHREELERHEDWNVGILYQPIQSLLDDEASMNVRWLPAPSPNNYRADPFGYVAADGQVNMLYEKYDHDKGMGDISRLRPKNDNVLKRSRTMLQTGRHLSYPYVVQLPEAIYVVPECAAAGRVELFRVNGANDALEPVCTLLEEPLFDPTLFQHEGRWWLLGTKPPLSNVALHAYHAEHLEGPYRPHPLNPVKLDIRTARPGGTPFLHEGQLYRPGQDSSRTYGGRIALNRIITLTPERFEEETVKFVGPIGGNPWCEGMHTISALGEITFIDGKRFVSVPQRRKEVRRRKLAKFDRSKGK
jgi:hypothetical protein